MFNEMVKKAFLDELEKLAISKKLIMKFIRGKGAQALARGVEHVPKAGVEGYKNIAGLFGAATGGPMMAHLPKGMLKGIAKSVSATERGLRPGGHLRQTINIGKSVGAFGAKAAPVPAASPRSMSYGKRVIGGVKAYERKNPAKFRPEALL